MRLRFLVAATAVVLALAGSTVPAAAIDYVPYLTIDAAPGEAKVAAGEHFEAAELSNTRRLSQGSVGSLPVFYADDEFGCVWTTALSSGITDWIALARRSVTTGSDHCGPFQQKMAAAQAAGADALILINNAPGTAAGTAAGTIPAGIIDQTEGGRLRDSLSSGNPNAVKVTFGLLEPGTFLPPIADQTGKVEVGAPFTWTGTATTGLNVANYWPPTGEGTCTHNVESYCETVFIEFSNPLTQAEIDAGKTKHTKMATITINNFGPVPDPATDFDLVVFESDAAGTKGEEIGSSANYGPDQAGDESVSISLTTTISQPSVFVLVDVVYFAVLGTGYSGSASF